MSELKPRKNLNPIIDRMEVEERSIVQKFLIELNNILKDHEKRLQKLEINKKG